MKQKAPHRLFRVSSVFLLFFLSISSGWYEAIAQSCCEPPIAPSYVGKFAKGANVTVTISPSWPATEREDIFAAFNDWTFHGFVNTSDIWFGSIVIGNGPIQSSNNQFVRYNPSLNVAGRNNLHNGTFSFWADMEIGPGYLNIQNTQIRREYFRGLIRHEIGHTFLLNNANSCPDGSTVMAPPGGVLERYITECDDTVICSVYSEGFCPGDCQYQQMERPYDPSGYGELDCSLCQNDIDDDCDGDADSKDYDCFDCGRQLSLTLSATDLI